MRLVGDTHGHILFANVKHGHTHRGTRNTQSHWRYLTVSRSIVALLLVGIIAITGYPVHCSLAHIINIVLAYTATLSESESAHLQTLLPTVNLIPSPTRPLLPACLPLYQM